MVIQHCPIYRRALHVCECGRFFGATALTAELSARPTTTPRPIIQHGGSPQAGSPTPTAPHVHSPSSRLAFTICPECGFTVDRSRQEVPVAPPMQKTFAQALKKRETDAAGWKCCMCKRDCDPVDLFICLKCQPFVDKSGTICRFCADIQQHRHYHGEDSILPYAEAADAQYRNSAGGALQQKRDLAAQKLMKAIDALRVTLHETLDMDQFDKLRNDLFNHQQNPRKTDVDRVMVQAGHIDDRVDEACDVLMDVTLFGEFVTSDRYDQIIDNLVQLSCSKRSSVTSQCRSTPPLPLHTASEENRSSSGCAVASYDDAQAPCCSQYCEPSSASESARHASGSSGYVSAECATTDLVRLAREPAAAQNELKRLDHDFEFDRTPNFEFDRTPTADDSGANSSPSESQQDFKLDNTPLSADLKHWGHVSEPRKNSKSPTQLDRKSPTFQQNPSSNLRCWESVKTPTLSKGNLKPNEGPTKTPTLPDAFVNWVRRASESPSRQLRWGQGQDVTKDSWESHEFYPGSRNPKLSPIARPGSQPSNSSSMSTMASTLTNGSFEDLSRNLNSEMNDPTNGAQNPARERWLSDAALRLDLFPPLSASAYDRASPTSPSSSLSSPGTPGSDAATTLIALTRKLPLPMWSVMYGSSEQIKLPFDSDSATTVLRYARDLCERLEQEEFATICTSSAATTPSPSLTCPSLAPLPPSIFNAGDFPALDGSRLKKCRANGA